jgi:hypothetical protein
MLNGILILVILNLINGPTWAAVMAGIGIGLNFVVFCVKLVNVGKDLS